MANAKRCDRCGKLFERAYVPDITIRRYHHGYGETRYDLCDECQKKLEKFMNNGKTEDS